MFYKMMSACHYHRNILYCGLLIFLATANHGCLLNPVIGPGYIVIIEIKDANFEIEKNIEPFEKLALTENFRKTHIHQDNNWSTYYYRRDLTDPKYSDLHYKFITIYLSYDNNEEVFSVYVMNDRGGQQEMIKNEIDRIVGRYIDLLSQHYSRENVIVLRKRTGPPF